MIELYRAIIPASKIINDNHGQHYRVHMGNLNWLTNQFNRIKNNEVETIGSFVMPSVESIKSKTENKIISIRCEVWRCRNTLFDPQNYAKTFKAPIDLLVHNGYFEDDNWKFVNGITYVGGGASAWQQRAIRFKNDGLPNEITPDWWKQYSDDYNDIMIRILIDIES